MIVGEGGCGKTCLLVVFTQNYFPQVSRSSLSSSVRPKTVGQGRAEVWFFGGGVTPDLNAPGVTPDFTAPPKIFTAPYHQISIYISYPINRYFLIAPGKFLTAPR